MKQVTRQISDRVARLKMRLGIQPKRWVLSLKRGGWLTIRPPMVRSLGLQIGDVIRWQLTPRGLEGVLERLQPGQTIERIKPSRLQGKDESIVYGFRPSARRCHQSGRPEDGHQLVTASANPPSVAHLANQERTYRGFSKRFKKRQRTVSARHFSLNFGKLLREVMLGRVLQITPRHGLDRSGGMALVPIALKERVALQHQRKMKRFIPSKAAKRW